MPFVFPEFPERLPMHHSGSGRALSRACLSLAVALAWLAACSAHAQEPMSLEPDPRWRPTNLQHDCARRTAACVAVGGTGNPSGPPKIDADQLRRRNLALIAASSLSVGLYGWKNGGAMASATRC
jgi:hypothetical protein